jgi:hypothetical protein
MSVEGGENAVDLGLFVRRLRLHHSGKQDSGGQGSHHKLCEILAWRAESCSARIKSGKGTLAVQTGFEEITGDWFRFKRLFGTECAQVVRGLTDPSAFRIYCCRDPP